MQGQTIKFNTYNIVMALFCIANLLELFIPRMDEGNYFVRIPIQMIYGANLFLMWTVLMSRQNYWTPVTKAALYFILLAVAYCFVYFLFFQFNTTDFAPYLRFLLWTTAIIFFYEMMLQYD